MGRIIRPAQAGTLESNDIVVMVAPNDFGSGIIVELESIVAAQYGEVIREVIIATVQGLGVSDAYIKAMDKGALDCTIEARTLAALKRAGVALEEGAYD